MTEQEKSEIFRLLAKMMTTLTEAEQKAVAGIFCRAWEEVEALEKFSKEQARAAQVNQNMAYRASVGYRAIPPKKRSAWDKFEHAITLGWLFD